MATTLNTTVRVAVDGKVTRGIRVPHRAANIKNPASPRIVAAPPAAHRAHRFAPGGLPKGVDLNITLAHDCANHLPDVAAVAAYADFAAEVRDDTEVTA